MLRPKQCLLIPIVFSASFSNSQARPSQAHQTAIQLPPSAALEQSPASLVLELGRAIGVLKRGLAENWSARGQYLDAFEKTPKTDLSGRSVTREKEYVACSIGARLRIHESWDEGPPIGVEVDRIIVEFTRWRNEAKQAATTRTGLSNLEGQSEAFQLTPCSAHRKVAISAGVAEGMLKTRIDPIYPGDLHVFGTVVLDATINSKGRVEALRVIGGPALLYQASLDAVRQWTYRPYVLNGVPVEVETTVSVIFAPSH